MDAISSKPSIHRLEGQALKRWWQVDDFFSFSRKKIKYDKYGNQAIRNQMMFFMILPFAVALYTYIGISKSTTPIDWVALTPRLLLMAMLPAALFIQFLLIARKHRNRILEVHVSDSGLNLKSLFLNRSIRWDQIRDFYKNQDDDYMLDTTSGDEFILSNELTNSNQLFELINRRAPKPPTKFSYNLRLRNDFIDSAGLACFAIIIACLANIFFRSFTKIDELIQTIAIASGGILICAIWWRLHLSRVAYLIRVGNQSIYIRTCTSDREIRWEELTDVKQRGVLFLVKTRSDWFVIVADREGPVSAPLIEFKQKRKLLKQG